MAAMFGSLDALPTAGEGLQFLPMRSDLSQNVATILDTQRADSPLRSLFPPPHPRHAADYSDMECFPVSLLQHVVS